MTTRLCYVRRSIYPTIEGIYWLLLMCKYKQNVCGWMCILLCFVNKIIVSIAGVEYTNVNIFAFSMTGRFSFECKKLSNIHEGNSKQKETKTFGTTFRTKENEYSSPIEATNTTGLHILYICSAIFKWFIHWLLVEVIPIRDWSKLIIFCILVVWRQPRWTILIGPLCHVY